MENLKKTFMVLSLVVILIGFGASVWLYMVLKDTTSIVMMCVFFVALIWFGFNVKKIFLPLLLMFSMGASTRKGRPARLASMAFSMAGLNSSAELQWMASTP